MVLDKVALYHLTYLPSLEPLAQSIRLSHDYSPINIHNTRNYISLYADDIPLYLNNVPQTLPHLLSILDTFGNHSGYKINKTKSALLSINDAMRKLKLTLPFPIVSHFKYLGIQIFLTLNETVKSNFMSTLNTISNDLKRWNQMTNTLQTRISVIKMNILPRINFLASMIPLPPPEDFWNKLNSDILSYLWKGKKPRFKIFSVIKLMEVFRYQISNYVTMLLHGL